MEEKNKIVYVVQSYRFADYESHSYIVGVFSTKEKAKDQARKEEEFRGGKYACTIMTLEMDKNDMQQDIKVEPTEFFYKLAERANDLV